MRVLGRSTQDMYQSHTWVETHKSTGEDPADLGTLWVWALKSVQSQCFKVGVVLSSPSLAASLTLDLLERILGPGGQFSRGLDSLLS